MTEVIVGLISAITGGLGVKIVEAVMRSEDRGVEREQTYLTELREEIAALKREVEQFKASEILWRDKYYDLLESFNNMKLKHGITDVVTERAIEQAKHDPNMIVEVIRQIVGEA